MSILILLIGIAAFIVLGLLYFVSAPPAQIASAVRHAGPALLALAGLIVSLTGRIGAGAPLIMMAAAWYGRQRRQAGTRKSAGQKSVVRSAWLEMELDHDTGDMNGLVLAGRFEGRELNAMSEGELRTLAADVRGDRESAVLLEAYLDRRMPGWRDDADAHAGARQAGPHDTGAMTQEEAYKILGLEPGATAADVRQAHRRLMQRVHPDLGGNAFLAQRVNEARDLLLRDHAD
ncbi:MAG: DnaJ domain-containing protein [Oricola sp.]